MDTSQQFIDVAGTGVKSGFGRMDKPGARTQHAYGMDLSYDSWGKAGEPIKNIAGQGKVVSVQKSNTGVGNNVLVEYDGGTQVRYNHLQDFSVKPGQSLAAGAVLGRMGSSGNSPSGAHISMEFRRAGKVITAKDAFPDAKFSAKWNNKTGSFGSATSFDLKTKTANTTGPTDNKVQYIPSSTPFNGTPATTTNIFGKIF